MSVRELKEFDLVTLRHDLPERALLAGDVGTVVFIYDDARAYEVEFVAADGRTFAVETLTPRQLDPFVGS